MVTIPAFLIVAVVIFGIGAVGVLISRNIIVLFMCVELMLNAANLALIAFSRALNIMDGHAFVFLVLAVAAAEAAVGLAILIAIFRNRETINIDRFDMLKW
ncbi:MAG: NADH-quinone oxidoreductase subunit NuoK [candidate division Zixibacteria bacterium]|nr:NADH-quinone oxidoreductase subunit NuoK [candidate division Zixibacteria bacterium]MCK4606610.1 NADH-quinone oxidoreductase subunit NuoK [candidate division Zixibacteria bacterium]